MTDPFSALNPVKYEGRTQDGTAVYTLDRNTNLVGIALVVLQGSYKQPAVEIAHLVEHLECTILDFGNETEEKSPLLYANANACTAPEATSYFYWGVLPNHIPEAIASLSRIKQIPSPLFLEREKKTISTELAMKVNPISTFVECLEAVVFQEYYREVTPLSERSVKVLERTQDDVASYIGMHHVPQNMFWYVVGSNRDVERIFGKLNRTAPKSRAHKEIFPNEKPLNHRDHIGVYARNDDNASIGIQCHIPGVRSTDDFSLLGAQTAFAIAGNEMWGPFYQELRQKQHLCYGLGINPGGRGNQATLTLSIETSPHLVRKVPDAYRKTLQTIADRGMTDHQISLIHSKILSAALSTGSSLDDPSQAIAACDMVNNIEIFRQASQVDNKSLKAVAAYILDQPQLIYYTFPRKTL